MTHWCREELPSDHDAIRALLTAAFGRADEAALVDRLRDEGDAILSLVAGFAAETLGHLMLSRMAAPYRALGLAPVAVAPPAQRRGIGGQLIRHAIARAAALGWHGIFVLGEPAYYTRFGFDPGQADGFTCRYAGPHFMLLPLSPGLPPGGHVAYAPAFNR